jgi:hypothetical protein
LRSKSLLTLDQEKFRDLPTIVTTILVDWHVTSSLHSLPAPSRRNVSL